MLRRILVAVVAGLVVVGTELPVFADGYDVDVDSTDSTADVTFVLSQIGGSASGGLGGPGIPCPTGRLSGTAQCSNVNGGLWNYGGCYIRVLGGGSTFQGDMSDIWHGISSNSPSFNAAHKKMQENGGEGSIIECGRSYDCPAGDTSHDLCLSFDYYWVPYAVGDANVMLAVAAAIAQMHIEAPQIATTRAGTMQLVGWPMWMWAANPGESTTGPVPRSATVGGVTVSATGTLDKTVWDMGDGHTVTCEGSDAPGTAYDPWYGGDPSPTCGYTYPNHADTPGSWYTVTMTAYWSIPWSGAGQSGTVHLTVRRSMQVQVGEYQTVIVPAPDKG